VAKRLLRTELANGNVDDVLGRSRGGKMATAFVGPPTGTELALETSGPWYMTDRPPAAEATRVVSNNVR